MSMIEKTLANAAVSGAGFWYLTQGRGSNINAFGMNMPVWAFGGLIGGAASIASDITSQYIIPHIPEPDRLRSIETAWLPVGASAGAWFLTAKMGSPLLFSELGVGGVLALGAISEVVALKIQQSLFESAEDIQA